VCECPARVMQDNDSSTSGRIIGRYVLFSEVAWGGMATVHLGKLLGPAGFARTVAIKRLHPPYAKDPEFVSMFLDEARLAARVRHPNVVSVLDVVARDSELFLVMDYVHGESLARLLRVAESQQISVPAGVAVGILAGVLRGLHAAHDARSDRGEPLEIVHRDVSPHNVLVGTDGVASVVDFGVAKATTRYQTTREGQLKGKLAYMAPEQLRLEPVDRRTDVYSASVVLWEVLAGRRLFAGDDAGGVMASVLAGRIDPPSYLRADLPRELDEVVLRGLASQPSDRYGTARDMAAALESVVPPATPAQIGEWVEELAAETLRLRSELIAEMESGAPSTGPERRRSPPARLDPDGPTLLDAPRGLWPDGPEAIAPTEPEEAPPTVPLRSAPSRPSEAARTSLSDSFGFVGPSRRSAWWLIGLGVVIGLTIALGVLVVGRARNPPAAVGALRGLPTPRPNLAAPASVTVPRADSPSASSSAEAPAAHSATGGSRGLGPIPVRRRAGSGGSLSFDNLTRQ
jgi:eukaryotic-like serine/threonine-protein kinase